MSMRASIQNVGMLLGVVALLYNICCWRGALQAVTSSLQLLGGDQSQKGNILNLPERFEMAEVKQVMHSFWITLRPLLLLPLIPSGRTRKGAGVFTQY
jgi:putative peptidoglycan lipid II flippase